MQQKLIVSSFFAAPSLMFISDLLAFLDHSKFFWASSILFWLSFYVFLLMIAGMWHLSDRSKYATLASLIAAFGCLMGITIIGMSRFAWGAEMEGVAPNVITTVDSNPWIFFTSRFPGITFPLGLLMLSLALKRSNVINNYILAGLVLSILLFPLGRIPKELMVNLAGDALMIIFFGLVGRAYQKMTAIDFHVYSRQ